MCARWSSPSTWTTAINYDWPWLYGVEVGHWNLTDPQAKGMPRIPAARRLLHVRRFPRHVRVGSFLAQHEARVSRPPDRRHRRRPTPSSTRSTISMTATRCRARSILRTRQIYEQDGTVPDAWRGIYDDKGRLMVAICHNMDLGDSWEHADNPDYPAEIFRARHPHRRQLCGLRDDALSAGRRATRSTFPCEPHRRNRAAAISAAGRQQWGPPF